MIGMVLAKLKLHNSVSIYEHLQPIMKGHAMAMLLLIRFQYALDILRCLIMAA